MKNNTNEYFVKDEDKKHSFKERCSQCLRGPKQIVRSLVLLTCTIVVIYQITVCLEKIKNPPITTYTHFDFNETINYPAVTVCRDPPYKAEVLEKYGLYGHPRYTSEWKYFPFDTVDLKDFWEEATYSATDNFIAFGVNHSSESVRVENSLNFLLGQCQTLYPTSEMSTALKETGFSILLNHSMNDMDTTSSTIPPGYHVHIHQADEPFTENTAAFLAEYLYVSVGEELEVKLTVQEMNMLPNGPKICIASERYSASMCAEKCRTRKLVDTVGCSGPWMNSSFPYCSNYTSMKDLIVNYIGMTNEKNHCDACVRRCKSKIYQGFVVDRNSFYSWNFKQSKATSTFVSAKYQTQLYIYFNNKMVSIYEETHNYDWSLFLADFGGSLGFLLGLSVVGVITLLEEICEIVIQPMVSKNRSRSGDGTAPASPGWSLSKKNRKVGDTDSIDEQQVYKEKNETWDNCRKFDTPFGEKKFYLE